MYIEVKDLKKSYGTGDSKVQVLRGVTTEVEQGKMCVIQGTSGSGKSTLLNCIGGLDTIDSGSVVVNGTQIAGMTQDALTKQPLDMDDLLETLGLSEHQDKFPSQLSGGQQQRCAIARALIKNPALLLCDEPTGALDSNTSRDILVLLEQINQKYGTTMLIVTHNNSIKNMVHQVIRIKDGMIRECYENETRVPAAELEDL